MGNENSGHHATTMGQTNNTLDIPWESSDPPKSPRKNKGILGSPRKGSPLLNKLRRKDQHHKDDPLMKTPVTIRRERLQEMEDQRPAISDKQIDILVHTWKIIKADLDKIGFEVFERWVDRCAYTFTMYLCI